MQNAGEALMILSFAVLNFVDAFSCIVMLNC